MDKEIISAIKRARSYWFVDGFTELLAGALFILIGGILWQRGQASSEPFPAQFVSLSGDITIAKIGGLIVVATLLWWLKNHFTYPRTGFVREKRVTAIQILSVIAKAALIMLLPLLAVVVAFIFLPPVRTSVFALSIWLPVAFGTLWAILIFIAGEWMGLRRFRLLGAWMIVAGIAIGVWQYLGGMPAVPVEALQPSAWATLPPALSAPLVLMINRTFVSVGLLTVLAGFALVVSGGVTFWRYRKENPTPYQEEA